VLSGERSAFSPVGISFSHHIHCCADVTGLFSVSAESIEGGEEGGEGEGEGG